MKKVIVLLMMMMPMVADAQRVDKPGEPYDVYCLLTYNIESKAVIEIESENKYICDSDGREIKFGSLPQLMTYMSKRGWIFVWEDEVKVLSTRLPRLLIRKTVTEDSQITEHLSLKDMIKKKKE